MEANCHFINIGYCSKLLSRDKSSFLFAKQQYEEACIFAVIELMEHKHFILTLEDSYLNNRLIELYQSGTRYSHFIAMLMESNTVHDTIIESIFDVFTYTKDFIKHNVLSNHEYLIGFILATPDKFMVSMKGFKCPVI